MYKTDHSAVFIVLQFKEGLKHGQCKCLPKSSRPCKQDHLTALFNDIPNQPCLIYIVKIPCGKDKISGNGLLNVKLVATDKAGREGEEEVQFDIDNTPPEITIITPDNNSEQSGIIEVIGTIKEDVKLYYAVSPLKTSPDKNPTEFSFKAKTSDTGADSGATLPTTDKDGNLIDLGKTEEEFNNYLKELCAYK